MNNMLQGLIITVVGMGGTLLSLGILILVINIAKRILPYTEEKKEVAGAAPGVLGKENA